MSRFSLVALVCVGCGSVPLAANEGSLDAERAQDAQCMPLGGTFSGVVLSDEEAQNAVDFADHGTSEELEVMLGIGPSIANRIITNRPYASAVNPMGKLDAVPYVGPVLLDRFKSDTYSLWCSLDDGRQGCCIDLSCDGLGGTFSGVEMTDADAQMVLDWANRASFEQLDQVCGVGASIATDIVAARPMHDVAELDAVSYVGPTLLNRLVGTDGYTCFTRDTVAEAWCDEDGACQCAETEPPVETPEAVDTVIDELAQLPADIQAAVNALVERTDWCEADFAAPNVVGGIVQHSVGGEVTGYTLDMTQAAEDFEFGWGITLDLDSSAAVLGSACVAF
jgi:DNA uptake protein ComE-like DNA-binding protein